MLERRHAIGKTFEHEVVLESGKVGIAKSAEGDRHIHRAFPVVAGQHLVDHHGALRDGATLELESDVVGDAVFSARERHT